MYRIMRITEEGVELYLNVTSNAWFGGMLIERSTKFARFEDANKAADEWSLDAPRGDCWCLEVVEACAVGA